MALLRPEQLAKFERNGFVTVGAPHRPRVCRAADNCVHDVASPPTVTVHLDEQCQLLLLEQCLTPPSHQCKPMNSHYYVLTSHFGLPVLTLFRHPTDSGAARPCRGCVGPGGCWTDR
eukprot:COSAG01_NODE_4786_length_4745_cov_95.210073_11_plen_117_part_00